MKKENDVTLVAPCGMYCGDCAAYKVKDDPSLGESLRAAVDWNGTPCPGCRPSRGKVQFVSGLCETYGCSSAKGVDFCFECEEFPCAKLNPAADKAHLPHNIKLYALSYIRQQGVDKWKEKAAEVKQMYYMGKMVIGKGPQLD